MRRHLKHLVTLAVVAGLLASASSASALNTVTVTSGGATAGTASASQFVLNTAGKTIGCTTTSSNATYLSGTFTSVLLPFTISNTVRLTFSGCVITGGLLSTVSCTSTAVLAATGITTTPAQVTPISLTSISCAASVTGAPCSVTIGGGVVGDHNNMFGRVTVATTGQTLTATGSSNGRGGACPTLPNDASVTLTDRSAAALVYTESPAQRITVT
jgi:hypothetical protein